MATDDLDVLATLLLPVYPCKSEFELRTHLEECLSKNGVVLSEGTEGCLVAYRTSRIAVLESVAVRADLQRTGVGSRLMERFLSWTREQGLTHVELEVHYRNLSSVPWFYKHGFLGREYRAHWFGAGQDALLMHRKL